MEIDDRRQPLSVTLSSASLAPSQASFAQQYGITPPSRASSVAETIMSIAELDEKMQRSQDKAARHGVDAAKMTFFKHVALLTAMLPLSAPSLIMAVGSGGLATLSLAVSVMGLGSVAADIWCAWRDWCAKDKGESGPPRGADGFANFIFYLMCKCVSSETTSQSVALMASCLFRFFRVAATALTGRLVPLEVPEQIKFWNEIGNDLKVAMDFVGAIVDGSASIADKKKGKNEKSVKQALLEKLALLEQALSEYQARLDVPEVRPPGQPQVDDCPLTEFHYEIRQLLEDIQRTRVYVDAGPEFSPLNKKRTLSI